MKGISNLKRLLNISFQKSGDTLFLIDSGYIAGNDTSCGINKNITRHVAHSKLCDQR